MRRGLIARSPVELPDAVFDARLDRVRAAMREAKLDALVIYTNNTRTAGVSWLVGFVPYWSEALLVVPRDERAVSRGGADLSRQNLDRARQPHRRSSAQSARRTKSRAANRLAAKECRRRRCRFRRTARRYRRRHARGRPRPRLERCRAVVCSAARQSGPGGHCARRQSRPRSPIRLWPKRAARRSTP